MSSKAFAVDAKVAIGQQDDGGFGLAVELHGIMPGVVGEKAAELMGAVHTICRTPRTRAATSTSRCSAATSPLHA